MQAEIKVKESEEEIEEIAALQMQKDLEMKLTDEIQKRLQPEQLEKKILEDKETKQEQEDVEGQEPFQNYGIKTENPYNKNKGAYHTEQPYEQNHDNQEGYENKR